VLLFRDSGKKTWSEFQPMKRFCSRTAEFLLEGIVMTDTRLNSRELRFWACNSRLFRFGRLASSAVSGGCDYKRSAVSSPISAGGGTLLLKICALEIIFSSCFVILAVSAGFLKPSGSAVSSTARLSKNS
jgi:hypothetical protein